VRRGVVSVNVAIRQGIVGRISTIVSGVDVAWRKGTVTRVRIEKLT